jgi:cystathionine beta-lyase/cystathionine gamma-synthase
MQMKQTNGFRTRAIHAGQFPADHHGAVMTPIYQTSTFAFQGANRPGPFDYSRSGNPTRQALERCLAELENGSSGFAFAIGMAAEATVLMMLPPETVSSSRTISTEAPTVYSKLCSATKASLRTSSTCATSPKSKICWRRVPRRFGSRPPPIL